MPVQPNIHVQLNVVFVTSIHVPKKETKKNQVIFDDDKYRIEGKMNRFTIVPTCIGCTRSIIQLTFSTIETG